MQTPSYQLSSRTRMTMLEPAWPADGPHPRVTKDESSFPYNELSLPWPVVIATWDAEAGGSLGLYSKFKAILGSKHMTLSAKCKNFC